MVAPVNNKPPSGPTLPFGTVTQAASGPPVSSPATGLGPGEIKWLNAAVATPKYQSRFELKDFQKKAIEHIEKGDSVVVTAPTGSGKTVLAYAAMMKALREGRTFIYTAPLKSISEQKLKEFRVEVADQMLKNKAAWSLDADDEQARVQAEAFVNENVGLITGDRKIKPGAPIKIMTTEVYNLMSRGDFYAGEAAANSLPKNRTVVFDELHYLGDPDRGRVWEESIMFTPAEAQVVGLSATVGNPTSVTQWINKTIYGKVSKTHWVQALEEERPVKLKYYSFDKQVNKSLDVSAFDNDEVLRLDSGTVISDAKEGEEFNHRLLGLGTILKEKDKIPAIFFILSRRACDQAAEYFAKYMQGLVDEGERAQIQTAITAAKAKNPRLALEDKYLKLLLTGVAPHHAEHLPEYKALVEDLYSRRLIKIVFATSTLAAGVNMPARTTVLTQLSRGTGDRAIPLGPSDFRQMAGRAGRINYDKEGNVIVFMNPGQKDLIKKQYIDSPSQNIASYLNANYQTLLTIINDTKQSDRDLEKAIDAYVKRSFMKFQGDLDKDELSVSNLKADYRAMIALLKQPLLNYIDSENKLTHKGKIAREIKFNNPLFVTEFIFKLGAYIQAQLKIDSQFKIRSDVLAPVLSLFAQDESECPAEGLQELADREKESGKSLKAPLIDMLIETQADIRSQQTKLSSVATMPNVYYGNLYAVSNWTTSCIGYSTINEVDRLKGSCENDSPGHVLDGLRRTRKLLEYLTKASYVPGFPRHVTKAIEDTKGIFDKRTSVLDQAI